MKLSVSAASAHAAMCAAVAAQLFLTLMLDFPATRNGAWLSALLAGLAAMPVALMLIRRENRPVRRVFKPSTAAFMAAALLDAEVTISDGDFTLRDMCGPGYAIASEAGNAAVSLMAREEGIFLDPVYTGKAFAGLLEMAAEGRFKAEDTVLFLHSGGAGGLFAIDME